MGRQSRRLRRRLRRIDSITQGTQGSRPRAYLVLWASVALGLIAGALVLENLRDGHLLGLKVEGKNLQSALSQLLTAWDVSAAWLSDLSDSGGLAAAPPDFATPTTTEAFPVFPGIAWFGTARLAGDEIEVLYTTPSGTAERSRALLSHPKARAAIDQALGRSGSLFSGIMDIPDGPCDGPMLVLLYHDGGSPRPREFVYSPACLDAMFGGMVSARHYGIEVFADGERVYRDGRPLGRFSFPLAHTQLAFRAREIDWLIEVASLPFPFNWQVAFPLFLFLGISGIGGVVFAWTRIEERERLLAEAMLETYRLTQKQSHFLAEASRLLAWHTDKRTESILPQIAARAVPLLGVGCGICLIEEGSRVRVVVAHAEPEVEAELLQIFERPISLPGFSEFLLRMTENQDKRIPEAELDGLLEEAGPSELLEPMRAALRHCVVVPMLARGKPIGAVVVRMTKGRRYGTRMVRVIHDFGSRIALALDNSRLLHDRQRAIRVREEFLSIASHELLTPVTALQTNIQSLLRLHRMGQEIPPERLVRALDVADRQVRRLGMLVHELLDVSRIESGKVHLNVQRFDLSELVTEIVARYEEEAERLGCRLSARCPPDAWGDWDRHRIEQVVTNLLSNAIKYGRSRPVHVQVGANEEAVWIRVEDQGLGIPREAIGQIFARFERAVRDTGYGGLGLGLYIAHQIVEAHGGRIDVVSEPGVGSVFTVTLPRGSFDEGGPSDDRPPLRVSTR